MILLFFAPGATIAFSPLIVAGWSQGDIRLGRVRTALATVTLALLSLAPSILLLALYAASWRAEALLGHLPRYILDDPKYIGPNDFLYQRLADLVDDAIWAVPLCFPCFISTLLLLRNSLPSWARWLAVIICALGYVAVALDPNSRLNWWFD